MLRENKILRISFKDFWQPLIITYSVTVLLVIIICVMQYNFSESQLDDITFYRVNLNSYILLALAKASESLAPTTITFSLLLILTSKGNKDILKTVSILPIFCLAGAAVIQPGAKNIVVFWIVLILIYIFIIISLLVTSSFVGSQESVFRSNHKFEKSDGKLSR